MERARLPVVQEAVQWLQCIAENASAPSVLPLSALVEIAVHRPLFAGRELLEAVFSSQLLEPGRQPDGVVKLRIDELQRDERRDGEV